MRRWKLCTSECFVVFRTKNIFTIIEISKSSLLISSLSTNFVRVYKKGFYKKRHKGEEESINGYASQWLSWIRPALFPVGKTWYVTQKSHDGHNITRSIYFARRSFFHRILVKTFWRGN